ncbi:MAG: hypothetical protein LKI24_11760 [Acidipropionibacterium sp.]|nr:hypothetical protein [Acidipropionibacterium sp.]
MATASPTAQISISPTVTGARRDPAGAPRHRPPRIKAALTLDLVVIALSTALAQLISARLKAGPFNEPEIYTPVVLTILPLWVLMIALLGGYRPTQLTTESAEYRRVLSGSLLTAGVLGVSAFLLKYPISRTFYVNEFLIGVPAVLIGHVRLPAHAQARPDPGPLQRQGAHRRRPPPRRRAGHHPQPRGLAGLRSGRRPHRRHRILPAGTRRPVVGVPEQVVDAARRTQVDTVIFTEGAYPTGRDFNVIARQLEHERAHLIVVPSVTDVAAARMNVPAGRRTVPGPHREAPGREGRQRAEARRRHHRREPAHPAGPARCSPSPPSPSSWRTAAR